MDKEDVDIHIMEHYSAIKKNEIMPFAATWMQLEVIILCEVISVSCSVVSYSLQPHGPWPARLCPWGFSRQEYWSGLPFPTPGDLHTQGSNLGLPHCRQILYRLSHQGSPQPPDMCCQNIKHLCHFTFPSICSISLCSFR